MVHQILTKTVPKRPWTTNSQRTQWLPVPQTDTHTSVWYLRKRAQQAPSKNFHEPSQDPIQNFSITVQEPQSKNHRYASTQKNIFLRPYSTKKNPSNKYFLWPGLELWPRGPQFCIPITSKGWPPKGDYTLHLHDAPKHVPLSKNGLWGLQI